MCPHTSPTLTEVVPLQGLTTWVMDFAVFFLKNTHYFVAMDGKDLSASLDAVGAMQSIDELFAAHPQLLATQPMVTLFQLS